MRLAVDVMGGDHGPEELLQGVKVGLAADAALTKVFVVGPEAELRPLLERIQLTDPRVEIRHASEVLTMHDDPGIAIRRKKDSSVMRAIELVREGAADAVISSGNTGALYAGSTVRLGRLEGVKRATIACILPSKNGVWLLVDGGANPECTPEYLFQFGIMGSLYMKALLGIERPRVGVLSNGSEEGKGTDATRTTARWLKQTDLNCNGYCEGYDLFLDRIDVCVCDGFVGNIVLKSSESLGRAVRDMLHEELKTYHKPWRLLGAALAKGGLSRIRERMNPEVYGGAPLLGLNGCVIKIHGRASRTALGYAMHQARQIVNLQLSDSIVRELARWSTIPTMDAPVTTE
ncbi:MAG TPA: phosphate acyltransferase PlsX [Candidatus Limnocylindria bacterium]|nr:phosphate acyltransferase PlsX [Candidatus Limnocylindria bacterium]